MRLFAFQVRVLPGCWRRGLLRLAFVVPGPALRGAVGAWRAKAAPRACEAKMPDSLLIKGQRQQTAGFIHDSTSAIFVD